MKDSVVIKSNKYGITLVLSKDVSFEQLIRDICTKFARSRDFFGNAAMVLTIEGRAVTAEESAVIIDAIQLNSDISILLVEEKQEIKDARMQGKIDKFYYEKIYDNAKIIKGTVANKDVVTSDSSIIILGDIKSRARVESAGNIIVFGTVDGELHAGFPNDNNCYIIANEIRAEQVSIGDITGDVVLQKKWLGKAKKAGAQPISIVVWERELLCEPIKSGLIKHI